MPATGDQMGAWEIHPVINGTGNVMRQMVPIWPVCWGYSCAGPTTYFGPKDFIGTGMQVGFSFMLEDDAELETPAFTLDSKTGHWTFGKGSSGTGASFDAKVVHKIVADLTPITGGLFLDGKKLAGAPADFALNTAPASAVGSMAANFPTGAFYVVLSRYVFAELDDFVITEA